MALDVATFETICPSRFISFSIPCPTRSDSRLRVAVLDSPIPTTDSPLVAAMFVPEGRETDWIFSTESGHLQLLFGSPAMSRLILIGNQFHDGDLSPPVYHRPVKSSLHRKGLDDDEELCKPLLLALCPRSLFKNGIPEIPILSYEDNLVSGVVIHKCVGCLVGEMLVEDVEIESESGVDGCVKREFRRRLRFKRMPNLIQTEIPIIPDTHFRSISGGIGEVGFLPDLRVLVHPYLAPMVASLSLISEHIDGQIQRGLRPNALCLGVGGGALLTFLRNQLGFEVVGVDADKEVLRVAKNCFGLEDSEFMHLVIGDAIKFVQKLSHNANWHPFADGEDVNRKFDVVMVDLDSSDVRSGVSAPTLEFVKRRVLLGTKLVLSEFGILVINVICPSRSFYCKLVHDFEDVFQELYKIDVGNGENFVLIATVSPQVSLVRDCSNSFFMRLKSVIPEAYINSITKI
ncbi:methyltransferase-like protein 13 [Senna tora]|uniref:Methyltransferase-like protein 13 n=1 Tax=Senna tora TaxID=362788 RepID=A0A834WGQ8_9FABA|nr:methyltransferase-like protein 13 [Senna tora]